ncbi:MAG: M15 family metallopeptidase [Lachnospiraceae bacterium]|nr:M15 family metallopeptidase [Lachnospiraceae bacterium]MCM1240039.1 M15 family metallopeptidase [Lachnospiraceae bacterium]
MDRSKLIKMLFTLSMIVVVAVGLTQLIRGNSMSLAEYEQLNASSDAASGSGGTAGTSGKTADDKGADSAGDGQDSPAGSAAHSSQESSSSGSGQASPATAGSANGQATASGNGQDTPAPPLTGAALNGTSQLEQRISLTEDFYHEPLSDNLCRYITGISYPSVSSEEEAAALVVGYDDLRYVHVLHYDFSGEPVEGELICNEYIAQDLVEIFYELYYSEYQIERVTLIDEYDGDDTASMEDNNTSCFNYRVVEGSSSLSKHAYGLAIDVNPFYNPYITYEKDGTENVSPAAAMDYADRSVNFPYKIDEDDLCCRLFKEHGFIWGGNWNSVKDYQHFQKVPK